MPNYMDLENVRVEDVTQVAPPNRGGFGESIGHVIDNQVAKKQIRNEREKVRSFINEASARMAEDRTPYSKKDYIQKAAAMGILSNPTVQAYGKIVAESDERKQQEGLRNRRANFMTDVTKGKITQSVEKTQGLPELQTKSRAYTEDEIRTMGAKRGFDDLAQKMIERQQKELDDERERSDKNREYFLDVVKLVSGKQKIGVSAGDSESLSVGNIGSLKVTPTGEEYISKSEHTSRNIGGGSSRGGGDNQKLYLALLQIRNGLQKSVTKYGIPTGAEAQIAGQISQIDEQLEQLAPFVNTNLVPKTEETVPQQKRGGGIGGILGGASAE